MVSSKKTFCFIFIITAIFCWCEAGNIELDIPQKCGIKNQTCQIELIESLVRYSEQNGIAAIGIPPTNPFELKNTTVSIIGMMDLIMIDGIAEGLTNCKLSKYENDIDKGITTSESLCESINIFGHYKITSGPLVQALSVNGISGEGIGAIIIDKLTLKLKIPYKVEKLENDEIYITPTFSEAVYSYVVGKITFEANNFMMGNEEVSQQLTTFMNNNWKIIDRWFGKNFSDKVMEVFYFYSEKFFQLIPAKDYISEYLSSYVKS